MNKKLFDEFLNDPDEVHALWLGFYSSFTQIKRHELPKQYEDIITKEYHYYTFGFWIGRSVQIIALVVVAQLGIGPII